MLRELTTLPALYVRQRRELAELIGFETRNKYAIQDERGRDLGYAAEQQKGFLGFLLRQFLGHWRTFEITVFDAARQPVLRAIHPFRWFFQRLEVWRADGSYVGALQQRFGIFTKKFDVEDTSGRVVLTVRSPFFSFWTFPFTRDGRVVAAVEKKWTGLLAEAFTDKDTFRVRYDDPALDETDRVLVLASALFVDLIYFEKKAD
jgi:uncharacterized protein YxjI